MHNRLDVTGDEMRRMGRELTESIARYYESLREKPLYPDTTSSALQAQLAEPLPDAPESIQNLLWTIESAIIPNLRQNGHPRALGYVQSPGTAVSAAGTMLAAAINTNVTAYRSAPSAAVLEQVVAGWIKELVGFPSEALGILVSGGSMANFSALAAARARAVPDAGRSGLQNRKLRLYASEEIHFSVPKAAGMLGMGEDNVRLIATDELFRIRVDALRAALDEDLKDGYQPMCIIGSAGTVATGAVDPLQELAEVARQYNTWFHVDGAYGGFASITPSARELFAGMELADSLSLDPHKWLYLSIGCGCVLYKDPKAARAAFAHDAEYTRPIGLIDDEAFVFWDYSPELSRPFRALPLWMQIKYAGAEVLRDSLEHDLACAKEMTRLICESEDFELLASGLSIFCFRYAPRGFAGDLDQLNEQALVKMQRAGSSYLSNARVHGKFALRGCVLNYRTTFDDMRVILEDVRKAASAVLQA